MTDKLLQCCYTNASPSTAKVPRAGWQAVAVSENMPPAAYNRCVKMQNANSVIRGPMVDEDGKPLDLLELCGDGNYLYIMRSKYGVKVDQGGRGNMFSHAYILPWTEEALDDPNVFLRIGDSNFKTNIEDAARMEDLEFLPSLELKEAMEIAGLSGKTYPTLIQCVYAQRELREPLYIQYDGTDRQLRALLYCIYWGLPRYLRRTLYAASAAGNQTKGKNVVFSKTADRCNFHLDPVSGENTVLNENKRLRMARYSYVYYAAEHYDEAGIGTYFRELEEKAAALGDPTGSDGEILLLSNYALHPELCGEVQLTDLLGDALRFKTGAPAMDELIAGLLEQIQAQQLPVSQQDMQKLQNRANSGQVSERLCAAVSAYEIGRFYAMTPEAAVAELRGMEPEEFNKYAKKFMDDPRGVELLNQFFIAQLHSQPITWETLKKAVRDAYDYPQCLPKLKDEVCREGEKLFQEIVDSHQGALEAFRAYASIMEMLNVPDLEKRKEQQRKYFWEKMELSDLSREDILNCQDDLQMETPATLPTPPPPYYERMCVTLALAKLMRVIQKEGMDRPASQLSDMDIKKAENDYLEAVCNYFAILSKRNIKAAWKKTAVSVAQAALDETVRNEYRWGDVETFAAWVRIVSLIKHIDLFKQIIKIRADMYNRYNLTTVVKTRMLDLESKLGNPNIPEGRKILCMIADDLARHWHKEEDNSNSLHVLLDTWLIIGTLQYGKEDCFHVFDGAEPKARILMDNPVEVVQNSKMLKKEKEYYRAAVKYVNENGQEQHAVDRWLENCGAKGNQQPPKVEEKKSGLAGLFGGGKRGRKDR